MVYLMFTLGVVFGALVVSIRQSLRTSVGSLKLDYTGESDSPVVLQLHENVDKMAKKRYISLKLDVKSNISQK